MTKELLEKLKGKTIKEDFYGSDFKVKVVDVVEEEYEEKEYLDGSYTKEELLELAEELGGTTRRYKVYGQLSKGDAKKVNKLQDLSKIVGSCTGRSSSGFYMVDKDYNNPILLKIFKDGEEPIY